MQNYPQEEGIREMYIPEEGKLFLFLDYNQEELCALAQTCLTCYKQSVMATLINKGLDLHSTFAAFLDGKITKEDVQNIEKFSDEELQKFKEMLKYYKETKEGNKRRKLSKIGNFGGENINMFRYSL